MQTASLILGVLALAFLFLPGANLVLSPMMGVAALVMGLIGKKQAREKDEDTMMGSAGFITGIIALGLSIVLIGACVGIVKHSGCPFKDKKKALHGVSVEFGELSDEFRQELREEIRREIEQEMERAEKERIRHWKQTKPWSDEEWRKDFEERLDEWVEWIEEMPLHQDIEQAVEEEEEEEKDKPPPPKKPAKKLPDTKYPVPETLE